jgi:antitoxin component YwqK of YwqJK toxin-antitoxin module
MKNLIYFFVFLFCSQLGIAQKNEPYQKNYDNGYVKISGQKQNGHKVGEWKEYFDNGQLAKVYSFTKGKRDNETKAYFKNGILKFETKRVDGVFISKGFYESGNLFFERILKNGYYKEFYEDGELKIQANYKGGELSGIWTSFFETGEKEWEVDYYNGYKKGLYKQYYKNGELKLEGIHSDYKKNGAEKRYTESGDLEWKGDYLKDVLHKKWKKIDKDGKVLQTLIYKNGVLTKSNNETRVIATKVPDGVIERVPVYPGCDNMTNMASRKCMSDKITVFVNKNYQFRIQQDILTLKGIQRIKVIFKIDKTGDIIDVRARGPHPILEKEAIRVIKMLPKMLPGMQRGKAVIVPYSLPIAFKAQ